MSEQTLPLPAMPGAMKDKKPGFAVPALLAVAVASGCGVAFGLLSGVQLPTQGDKPGLAEAALRQAEHFTGLRLQNLPNVLTTLADPPKSLVRLQASIAVEKNAKGVEVLAAKIGEDFLAYLRTVRLADLEGASGLLFLREDLLERARIRSHGVVRDVIIETFAVE